jgi:hypothetical protein
MEVQQVPPHQHPALQCQHGNALTSSVYVFVGLQVFKVAAPAAYQPSLALQQDQ